MTKNLCLSIIFLMALQLSSSWGQTITTVAGTGELYYAPDGIQATDAQVAGAVAFDSKGNYYIANSPAYKVFKVDASTGVITTVAGTGTRGYSGEGGLATSAQLYFPSGIAVDASDNLFIVCQYRIRKVDASTGVITTVAGTGTQGYGGDGGPATSAQFNFPEDVAVDGLGNLYIADQYNNRVRKVNVFTGLITTIAGTGVAGYNGDGGPATSAQLNWPSGIEVDALGNLYIADQRNDRIRKVDSSTGVITTIAGTGIRGYNGNGLATSTHLNRPSDIVLDETGNLYFADRDNNRIRKVEVSSGMITTLAGTGAESYGGDGGPAINAQLNWPSKVEVDDSGDVYISDYQNQRIRKVDFSTGVINTVAGTGSHGYSGDGSPATSAQLNSPTNVEVDNSGDLYIVDERNFCIRKVDASTGVITTIAGTGDEGYSGDGGPATSAQLLCPSDVAIDGPGNVYIADQNNSRIRKVDVSTGVITTIAGTGTYGYSGDGGPATSAQLYSPSGVAIDGSGNLYITDVQNNCIRKVDASTGVITTVAGTGTAGYSGDGGHATSAQFYDPEGIAVDGSGNLYIADRVNHRIRRVDVTTGIITTVAGTGSRGYSGDGGPATSAQLYFPIDVTVDLSGNLYIADLWNERIRKVDVSTGVITTVAGTGTSGYSGDGGPATSAQLYFPIGVTLDGSGNFYIADRENHRIRKISDTTPPTLTISSPDDDPTNASSIPITFEFDEYVSGFTASDITVTKGSISNFAGAGNNYTADLTPSADGIVTVDITANVATDAAGNANNSATQFSITYDTSTPIVSSVTVPASDTYFTGDVLIFNIHFSEIVTINAAGDIPQLSLTIGSSIKVAEYISGSGSEALRFRYIVQVGDEDKDGITINGLDANGAAVKDKASNDAELTLNSVGSTALVFMNFQVVAGLETLVENDETETPVIYSGFTPDGDGVNDDWVIDNTSGYPHMNVRIYNKDGQELFRSTDGYRQPWDGTYNGRQLPAGTYYYIIRLNDQKDRTFKGTVTILK